MRPCIVAVSYQVCVCVCVFLLFFSSPLFLFFFFFVSPSTQPQKGYIPFIDVIRVGHIDHCQMCHEAQVKLMPRAAMKPAVPFGTSFSKAPFREINMAMGQN